MSDESSEKICRKSSSENADSIAVGLADSKQIPFLKRADRSMRKNANVFFSEGLKGRGFSRAVGSSKISAGFSR
jgi:hypothetical protein